jgi:type VI secretion system protein ImpA
VLRTAEKILAPHLPSAGSRPRVCERRRRGAARATWPKAGAWRRTVHQREINSREDVIRVLDKIVSYYERAEPSSPIPLLIKRSKRLVSASFLDIVRDIASDGLAQVENLRGKDESNSS